MVQAKEQTQAQRSTRPVQNMFLPRERLWLPRDPTFGHLSSPHLERLPSTMPRNHQKGSRVIMNTFLPSLTAELYCIPGQAVATSSHLLPYLWRPHYISEIGSTIRTLNLMQTCTPSYSEDSRLRTTSSRPAWASKTWSQKVKRREAKEMAQQSRALNTLAEDLCSIPSMRMAAHSCLWL